MENGKDNEEVMDNGSSTDEADNSELSELKKKYSDLDNRFLRLAADFDNYKKRVQKEKTELTQFGNEDIIKELLNVLDNLQLAVTHAHSDTEKKSIVDGVKLVLNQFLTILERFGLKAIDSSKGTEFDPRYHDAFERIETEEFPPGIILEELVKGYTLKDRLLRPASVTISTDLIKNKSGDAESIAGTVEEKSIDLNKEASSDTDSSEEQLNEPEE